MKIKVYSSKAFEVAYFPEKYGFSHTTERLSLTTCNLAAGFDAVCIFTSDDASAGVLEKLAALKVKYIALRSAGFDHVDIARARELNIKVANVPAYSPFAVAEHAVAMMMALNRKLIQADGRIKRHDFTLDGLTGFDMHGKTVGIVGLGRIGSALASILHGFKCNLIGYDLQPDQTLALECKMTFTDLDNLYRQSDIISVHLPLTLETKHLINKEKIAMMKAGVMLINTARGAIVDTNAVVEGIKSGHIGSYGMDVYEKEAGIFFYDHSQSILQDDQLALLTTFPNVLITAHQAFLTETALKNISDITINNLNAWRESRNCNNTLV